MAAKEIPMAGYASKLLNRFEVAQDTIAFHFEKPIGFDFKWSHLLHRRTSRHGCWR